MQNVPAFLAFVVALAVYLTVDTAVIVRTGRAPGLLYKRLRYRQMYGPVTRAGRPRRYWAYVFGNVVLAALCVAYVGWVLLFPETLNRTLR